VTVKAVDSFGQTALEYRGTAHFSSADGQAILPSDYPTTLLLLFERYQQLICRPAGGGLYSEVMSDVTRILNVIEQGDPHAASQLLPLVYDELRRLAAQKLALEKPGQTLDATALVHEAYVRLVDNHQAQSWNSRGHFFAAAAEAMRRILVEQARRRKAAKRGGQAARVELDEAALAAPEAGTDILAVHDALEHFATIDAVAANLVKLRFFAGLNMTEAAQALGMSVRSAQDLWAYARSWLHRKMRPD
jgi:RNA polymerase sigma factor (TIGR02999 family)